MEQQQQSNSRPVTGYPAYPNGHAPPPQSNPYQYQPYPYPYNNYATPQPNPRATFLRRFLILTIALFIVFGAVLLIVWLLLRPRVPQFRVHSASVSNFNVSSQQVTGTWQLGFQVLNPNKKMSVSYDDIDSVVYYKSQFLAQTRIPPFDQGTRNQTSVSSSFSASGSYVADWVLGDVNGERKSGSVSFNARIMANVAFRASGWRPRRRILRVLCEDVPIRVLSNGGSGELVGGAKECRVGLRLCFDGCPSLVLLGGPQWITYRTVIMVKKTKGCYYLGL